MTNESDEGGPDRFLATITPQLGDPTFSILKAHLLFEEVLREFLQRCMPNPRALLGARLSFAQVLALVRALQPPEFDDWQWEAVFRLNSLRNQFAHHLTHGEREAKIDAYVSFVTSSFGLQLPPPEGTVSSPPATGGPFYQAVDMANVALFASIEVRLQRRNVARPGT